MPESVPPHTHLQRLHDLRSAHSDFKAVLRLLQSGYRFDDGDAASVLKQLERAVASVEQEIRNLETDWSAGSGH